MHTLWKQLTWLGLGVLGVVLILPTARAIDANDPRMQAALRAISNTSTYGHPDLFGEMTGMQLYARGDYAGAMKRFVYAARYADKPSQYAIGLLYLNGEGVRRDPIAAYAWIALACERNYPQFVGVRDALWSKFDVKQQGLAKAAEQKLLAEFGDAVTQPRMALELRRDMREMTGSRLGFNVGVDVSARSLDRLGIDHLAGCSDATVESASAQGCGNAMLDRSSWDATQYFKMRDAAWTGHVDVGPLQAVDKPPADKPSTR